MINKQAKLIDGQALLEDMKEKKHSLRDSLNFAKREGEDNWADELREQMQIYTDYIEAIESGRFDSPSDSDGEWKAISEIVQRENEQLKAENDRLRAALEHAEDDLSTWTEDHHKGCDCHTCANTLPAIRKAISTTTDTGAERAKASIADRYKNALHGWHNPVDRAAGSYYNGYLNGVRETLRILGITIPGINAPEKEDTNG